MNNLLLLAALGAGYVYFTKPKTTTKKSTTTPKTEPPPKNGKLVAGSKEIGYEIYDCNKLIIYNTQKAYDYAFNLGLETEELYGQFDDILFGKCFEDAKDLTLIKQTFNSLEKAKFAFNLLKYAFSGYLANMPLMKDDIINHIKGIKSKFVEYLGFKSDDFDVELIVKNIDLPKDKGFVITNCQTFNVTDPVKMKKYMDNLLIYTFNLTNYKDSDFNAPFDFSVEVLKSISPECYAKVASNNFTKDNFIISYMFIMTAFFAYISFKYLMKDGVIDQLNWQESFASKEEWDAFMINAMKVLSDWVSPLFIKFDLNDAKMQEYVIQIQKSGKYPVE
jgi:hypothetical protein